MKEEEFWNLTPVEYQSLVEQWEQKEQRSYQLAGTVAAAVYNCYRDSVRHPQAFTWQDIFPAFKTNNDPPEASEEQIDMFFQGVLASHKNGEREH